MTETQTPAETTATPNLRETRKEQAAKKAPAKKAPAKKAPAPKAATPTAPAARKLRWTVGQEHTGGKEQAATVGDHTYAISKAGEGWTCSVTVDGKATLLVTEGKFAAAYGAAVKHNRERA